MRRHYSYLKYLIRHKWFVFIAGISTGAPVWRLVVHDWSKFLPSEWGPYARTFYKPDGSKQYTPGSDFDRAWNYHQKRNKHHWQYWTLYRDDGSTDLIPIPDKYIREMVADWAGAGRVITGEWDVCGWYKKNASRIRIHHKTRERVVDLLQEFE